MDYRFLGNTGLRISEYAFGTMSFGGDADEKTARELFHICRDAGVNTFDCANVYNDGRAEEILGALISDCREEVIITSKVYFPTGEDVNARGSTRKHIRSEIEKSLRRLNTEYIDIYFLHRFDARTPIENTLRVLDDLVRQGKILYPAASNFAAWQVEKALGISAREGLAHLEVIQPMYNLVKRQAEVEIFPMAATENLGVLPYSPLGGGLLTGKYSREEKPETGRLTENEMYQIRYGDEWIYRTAEKFTEFAAEQGFSPVSLALAWVAGHPAVTAPLMGARNPEQLREALGAVKINMTPELRAEISALSPTPPPATDRNEERTEVTFGKR